MKATDKQKKYIKNLLKGGRNSFHGNIEELSFTEASKLIDNLKNADNKDKSNKPTPANSNINEARLGMAIKETFRKWLLNKKDMLQNEEAFMQEALKTYKVFTEIGVRAEKNN